MWAYFSALFTGDADAVRSALLYGAVVGGIIVAIGIIWESKKLDVATAIVVVGVFLESLCTIKLFAIDEGISNEQKAKIISLEARPWTKQQYDAIQSIKGRLPNVGIIAQTDCVECLLFSHDLVSAFHDAGAEIFGDVTQTFQLGMRGTGIFVFLPAGAGDGSNDPVIVALKKADLMPGWMRMDAQFGERFSIRTDVPIIQVGERFPQYENFPYTPKGGTSFTIHSLRK